MSGTDRSGFRRKAAGRLGIAAGLVLGLLAGCGDGTDRAEPAPADGQELPAAPATNPLGGAAAPASPEGGAPVPRSGLGRGAPTTFTSLDDGSTRVTAAGVRFDVPAGWQPVEPSSSMRAAQFAVGGEGGGGGEGAEFVVFRGIGGSAQENVSRWVRQFGEGAEPTERRTVDAGGGLLVHRVEITGTYDVGPMMGGSGPRPGTTLRGGVIDGGPSGLVFLRLVGPSGVVAEAAPGWEAVVGSVALEGGAD